MLAAIRGAGSGTDSVAYSAVVLDRTATLTVGSLATPGRVLEATPANLIFTPTPNLPAGTSVTLDIAGLGDAIVARIAKSAGEGRVYLQLPLNHEHIEDMRIRLDKAVAVAA